MNRKALIASVTIAGALALTGCSGGAAKSSPSTSDPAAGTSTSSTQYNTTDSAFLSVLQEKAPTLYSDHTPTDLITLGHSACADWNNGFSLIQILEDGLTAFSGEPPSDVGIFVGAATGAYCPQYADTLITQSNEYGSSAAVGA